MADKKDPKTDADSDTVDHDSTGIMTMPSITRLLNRKTFMVSKTSGAKEPTKTGELVILTTPTPNPPMPPASVPSLQIGSEPTPKPLIKSTVRVQKAKQISAEQRGVQRVALWDPKQLKGETDPLGKGLAILLEQGAQQALFLSITPAPAGSPVPHFLASAAIAPRERLKVWTGLKWDPTIVPSLWNLFVRSGHAELPPSGADADLASNRNVVRTAFGAAQHEWLLLVRAGTLDNCRGVLAVISGRSMLEALALASPLLAASIDPDMAQSATKKAS